MTNEEALHHITVLEMKMRNAKMCDEIFATDYVSLEDLCLAISALEKQIPQKGITETDTGSPMHRCPVCDKRMIGNYYAPKCYYNFCAYCGQRIDWPEWRGETDE